MQLVDGYLTREIMGSYVLIPVGQKIVDSKNILKTNETGYFIMNQLLNDISYDELLSAVNIEYEVAGEEQDIIKKDLDSFLQELRMRDLLCI